MNAVTLLARESLSRDPQFRRRVLAAAVVCCLAVCSEDPATPLHAARREFAVSVLRQPTNWVGQFALAASGHEGVTADRLTGTEAQAEWSGSDADFQFIVNAVFPALAVVADS